MQNSVFNTKARDFSLKELANISSSKIYDEKHAEIVIKNIASLKNAGEGDISFLQNPKYNDEFKLTKATACIISEKNIKNAPEGIALLISDNPYYSYAMIAQSFYPAKNSGKISDRANISSSAKIGNNVSIAVGVFIGDNVIIGDNSVIHANVVITHAIIGKNVIIHPNTSIGQDGFGYAFHQGVHHKVPQLGRVIIEDNVEIGSNVSIDRGAGPDTIIGAGTKIDNLVQIGHNVKVGKACIIVSHVGISGSTEIGDYTVIGGQVGIAGHLKVGSRVQIAAQSGVMRDVEDGDVLCGSPAVPIKQFHRQTIALEKLVKNK
jgi:UDP-3-O-[3-hydroxymyristoyl] glucosamine N-acyltransferase